MRRSGSVHVRHVSEDRDSIGGEARHHEVHDPYCSIARIDDLAHNTVGEPVDLTEVNINVKVSQVALDRADDVTEKVYSTSVGMAPFQTDKSDRHVTRLEEIRLHGVAAMSVSPTPTSVA